MEEPISILVADDARVIQHVVKHTLEKAGYDVAVANDGAEALELLNEEPFDLVITDVMMPELDGLGLVAAMRANEALSAIPIIMMTGAGNEQDVEIARSAEPDGFLTKPVSSHHLLAEVERLQAQLAQQ